LIIEIVMSVKQRTSVGRCTYIECSSTVDTVACRLEYTVSVSDHDFLSLAFDTNL